MAIRICIKGTVVIYEHIIFQILLKQKRVVDMYDEVG